MSAFNLATAFVQFAAKDQSTVDKAVDSVKAKLQGLDSTYSSGGSFKGFASALVRSFSTPNALGRLKADFGSVIGDFKHGIEMGNTSGWGMIPALRTAFSVAAPQIAALLGNPITAAIVAAVGAAVALISIGIPAERARAEMTVRTGGNAGLARSLMGGLKEQFAGTGVSQENWMERLKDLTSQTTASGKPIEANKIKEDLKALGNVSEATGQSFMGMATAMERAELTGKVSSRTLFAMKPVAEELQRALGVDEEELMKMASKGNIGIEHLRWGLQKLGGESGVWGKMLETQKDTVEGQLSIMGTSIKSFFTEIGVKLIEGLGLKHVFGLINDALGALFAVGRVVLNILGPAFKVIGYAVGVAFAPIRAVFNVIKELASMIGGMWAGVGDRLDKVFGGSLRIIRGYFEYVGKAILLPFKLVFSFINAVMSALSKVFEPLFTAFGKLWDAIKGVFDPIVRIFNALLGGNAGKLFETVISTLLTPLEIIVKAMAMVVEFLASAVKQIADIAGKLMRYTPAGWGYKALGWVAEKMGMKPAESSNVPDLLPGKGKDYKFMGLTNLAEKIQEEADKYSTDKMQLEKLDQLNESMGKVASAVDTDGTLKVKNAGLVAGGVGEARWPA